MGSTSFLTCRVPAIPIRLLLTIALLLAIAIVPFQKASAEDLQADFPQVQELLIPADDSESADGPGAAVARFDAFLAEEVGDGPETEIPPIPPVPDTGIANAESNLENEADPSTEPYAPQVPGYWIVSSWKSPQDFKDDKLCFLPQVRRVDECTEGFGSSMEHLTGSLVPGVPICIVVHGSFMDSPSVLPDSHQTWNWLKAGACGRPFQMIYFSWPSDRALSPLASIDVAILGSRASRNGFFLASLIQSLPPECPVCLVGHSHGTRVISSALHLLAGGVVEDHRHCGPGCSGRRIRVVYTASAIDHDWLNPEERFGRALCCVECLINLRNSKDPALQIYPLRRIASSRALGAAGFTSKDRRELGAYGSRVRDWDVSSIIGRNHAWPNYVAQTSLSSSLRHYLFFANE